MSHLSKDETFWSVLNSAIELDFKRGHLRWTMSELSRMSKVTRSLIYYYFGKSKEAILLEAVKLIGEEFFGLNSARIDLWQKGQIADSVLQTRRLMEKCPHMGTFYMVHREEQTDIGASLRQLETEYKQKLKRFFSTAPEANLEAVFGLFMGLVITPGLSDDSIRVAVGGVLQLTGKA
ncbi:MAG: TetR/AcrR family transcriptional regulator [Bdellovibrionota bacterium]